MKYRTHGLREAVAKHSGGYMKRYEMNVEKQELGDLSAHHVEYTHSPSGEWVKFEDHKKAMAELTAELEDREPVQAPVQTPRGQQMAELSAKQIEADKLTRAQLKQRILARAVDKILSRQA